MERNELYFRESIFVPELVSDFLNEFISQTNATRIFIPFAAGEEIVRLKKNGVTVDFFCKSSKKREWIEEKAGITPKSTTEVESNEYNLVFSQTPFGSIVKESLQLDIVEEGLDHLAEGGNAIFVFSRNATMETSFKRMKKRVELAGGHIAGIIDLNEGVYAPETFVASRLLIISKENNQHVFLAKIKKAEQLQTIVKNFLEGMR